MKDIENLADIQIFVDAFYTKVQQDKLLAPVFALRIENNKWQAHLDRMYGFWNTVLFFKRMYKGNPFAKHATLPIQAPHFEQWLALFIETIDTHFEGKKAEETKRRAANMANLFTLKLGHIQGNSAYKTIV